MALLFKKKSDPISARARALSEEIAALEAKIKKLGSQVQQNQTQPPRLRSTAIPHVGTIQRGVESSGAPAESPDEPIFEEVDRNRLNARGESATTPEHYNQLGVRKYDLPALMKRVRHQISGPSTTNPKLVSYLAAGGIQGLRPMRYEKRIARNRFITLVVFLFFMLLGIIVIWNHH
jgi:hypothetical protein